MQYQYLEDYNDHFNAVSGGLAIGTRYVFIERLSLDFYLGFGGKKSWGNEDDGVTSIYLANYTGILGKANLQFGVAF